jgi:formylglycine-generating enzyme required for sulfatase activity
VVETCLQKDPAHRYQTAAKMVVAIDHALVAEGSGNHIPRPTVLSTEGKGELISRRGVVRLPGEDKPAGRFKPVWGMAMIIVIFILAVAAYGPWRSQERNAPPVIAATQPASIATAEEAAQTLVQPTSTIGPTFTPLPTATPEPSPTPTAEPTATLQPTATDISNSFSPTITGNDGMTMRLVPAGNFIMGSTLDQVNAAIALCRLQPDGDSCAAGEFNIEIPQHTVYVSAFYMDETEVTNGQYRACVEAGGCAEPESGSGRYRRSDYYDQPEFASYPVVWVSWFDARTYCAWAGKRLPTEAEWEKAARGEDGRIFPWGNDFSSDLANTQDRGQESLAPVGHYPAGASPYGILDMAGGVWEYVEDWFDPGYYANTPASDPPGPASSPGGDKVLRSGSYANFQHYARVANRGSVAPATRTEFRGIRCAADAAVVGP